MKYFDPDEFAIALLLEVFRHADPKAESLGAPPLRMSSGTDRFDGDWVDPKSD